MKKEYKLKGITIDQLSKKLDEVWDELQSDSGYRRHAIESGIDLEKIRGIERSQAITIEKDPESGIDADTAVVIVAFVETFGPVAAKILQDLWDNYCLPMIKRGLGDDVLEE